MTRGREKVVELVEQAYYAGNDHCLDASFATMMKRQQFCLSNCFILLLLCITGGFIYFLIDAIDSDSI